MGVLSAVAFFKCGKIRSDLLLTGVESRLRPRAVMTFSIAVEDVFDYLV